MMSGYFGYCLAYYLRKEFKNFMFIYILIKNNLNELNFRGLLMRTEESEIYNLLIT